MKGEVCECVSVVKKKSSIRNIKQQEYIWELKSSGS